MRATDAEIVQSSETEILLGEGVVERCGGGETSITLAVAVADSSRCAEGGEGEGAVSNAASEKSGVHDDSVSIGFAGEVPK